MPFMNFSSAKPTIKVIIIFMSIFTIGVIVFFIGLLISKLIFWMHLDTVNDVLYGRIEKLSDWQIKYYQVVQTIGFFIIPGIFLHWIFSSKEDSYFEVKKKPKLLSLSLVLLAFIIGLPLMNWFVEINQKIDIPDSLNQLESELSKMEESYSITTNRLLSAGNFSQYLFNILMIAILPAIGEEFVFRGVFQRFFKDLTRNKHLAILFTAIIFSAIHGQYMGFFPRLLLGIFFGYLFVWSNTIWLPVFAHFINNFIEVTYQYLYANKILSVSPEDVGLSHSPFYVVLISLVMTAIIIYLIKNTSNSGKVNRVE